MQTQVVEDYIEVRKSKYTFDIKKYPKVVLITVTLNDSWKRGKEVKTFLMSRASYNKYKGQKSWRWVLNKLKDVG